MSKISRKDILKLGFLWLLGFAASAFSPYFLNRLRIKSEEIEILNRYCKGRNPRYLYPFLAKDCNGDFMNVSRIESLEESEKSNSCKSNKLKIYDQTIIAANETTPRLTTTSYANEDQKCVYVEAKYLNPNTNKDVVYQKRIMVNTYENDNYQVWVCSDSDMKDQSWSLFQGEKKERGDISVWVVSKKESLVPVGIVLDLENIITEDGIDEAHKIQLDIDGAITANMVNNRFGSKSCFTKVLGSCHRKDLDVLRADSISDLEKDIDAFREFSQDFISQSVLLFQEV